jgi:hypothetical protein
VLIIDTEGTRLARSEVGVQFRTRTRLKAGTAGVEFIPWNR